MKQNEPDHPQGQIAVSSARSWVALNYASKLRLLLRR